MGKRRQKNPSGHEGASDEDSVAEFENLEN